MAAVTLLGTQTFNANSGTKTVTATPAVGDLIVIITAHTGNTSSTAPTDNQAFQPGYDLINSAVKATSADTMRIWIRRGLIGSASSTVFSHAPGTSSGGGLAVFKVTGMGRVGSRAARQSAIQSNQAGGGTPTPVFGSAALTGNAVIGAVFNATNPATMTARGTPAYTERFDTGYATPTTGLEAMSIDSGETGTSIAWGSTSGSAFASLALELDASAEDVNLMGEDQTVFDTPLRNKLVLAGLLTLSSPLTLTGPPVQSTDVPRSPVYFSVYQKPLVTPFQPPNLLTSTLAPVQALPFVSQSQEPVPPRKPSHWVWEPVQNTLLQVTLPNIGSSLDPAPEPLFPVYDSSLGSNPALFPAAAPGEPPGIPEHFDRVTRKADYRDSSASSPRVLLDTEVFKPFSEIVWPNAVRRNPLYNLAFDSFFSPDKIPEPPPPPPRVEIEGGGPKKRTKSAKEELREILNEPKAQALVPADPAPELPKPLKPVAKVVIVPEYNPPIVSIPIDQPLPAQKVKPPPDEAEIAEIRFLISLGLL